MIEGIGYITDRDCNHVEGDDEIIIGYEYKMTFESPIG